jgi:hypothetical protein
MARAGEATTKNIIATLEGTITAVGMAIVDFHAREESQVIAA